MKTIRRIMFVVMFAFTATAMPTAAQTIKIGVINTYSGPTAGQGDQIDKGIKLYLKLNAYKLPPGVKVETIIRDDTGPNPDTSKRLAQELIMRDKVQFLTGVVWTPNAAAMAPLITEAKVPFIISNAAGVTLTSQSPYMPLLNSEWVSWRHFEHGEEDLT